MKGVKYKNPSFFSCFREGKGGWGLHSTLILIWGQAVSGGGWRRLSFCKQDIYLDNRAGIALILI